MSERCAIWYDWKHNQFIFSCGVYVKNSNLYVLFWFFIKYYMFLIWKYSISCLLWICGIIKYGIVLSLGKHCYCTVFDKMVFDDSTNMTAPFSLAMLLHYRIYWYDVTIGVFDEMSAQIDAMCYYLIFYLGYQMYSLIVWI